MGKYAVKMGDRGGFFEKMGMYFGMGNSWYRCSERKQLEPFGKDSSCLLFFLYQN